LPSSSGDKLCPICDSPLQPGSKKCSFCGTDLSIFDIDVESPKPAEAPPASPPSPKPSVESRIEEIFSKPLVPERPAPAKPPKPEVAETSLSSLEPAVGQEAEAEPEPEVKVEKKKPAPTIEYFECPQCGTAVETTASSCPKCGVLFAEEGADMFQCPACNTLVSVDAKTCPGCGALFVEPGEEPVAEPSVAPEPVVGPPKAEAEVTETTRPAPEAPKVEEEKKGFFGLFKRAKKEEPPPAKPAKPAKPTPAVEMAPPPKKAPEPVRTEARIPAEAPPVPAGKDKGKELARMVAEMKPLLSLAREKEVDIGQSKELIDEAAVAGRERQLDRAIELVQRSKTALMSKIDMQLADEITRLNDEIRIARDFGGDTARASTYVQEIVRARSSGDVEAAYVYVDKVKSELLPITGRYNESKKKVANMKELIGNAELFIVDTKEARSLLVDASKALDMKDFDKLDTLIKTAQDKLYKAIPSRMNEEMKKAKAELVEAKMRNVNITPMITVLKSATNLMKAGDYAQALREMRDFKQMMKAA
jgi:cellobiose-specific phosphotransferase system component IIA/RNA polymerase subunit RPABC4/transcription elongation factor Spt4